MQHLARSSLQIGAALQWRRKELGLTQKSLADRISARQATISRLERGAEGTEIGTLLDVISALQLEIIIQPRTTSDTEKVTGIF